MVKPNLTQAMQAPTIHIQQYERYLPSAFDESLSILQKINKVIHQLNLLGEISNNIVKQWNELMLWILNEGLTEVVSKEIDKRIEDGTFDDLIYKIIGDLSKLETVNKTDFVSAINEINKIANENKDKIGNMDDLKTTHKDTLVESINELKEVSDINYQSVISIGEATGYGTISGLKVTQQANLAMAVEVGNNTETNIVHLPNGVRHVIQSVALPIDDADSTLNRIDLIYVNGDGIVSYLAGALSQNPVAPQLPQNSVPLAEIKVVAGDTTINNVDIIDKRPLKGMKYLLTSKKENLVVAINELVEKMLKLTADSATKADVGDKNDLHTINKNSLVESINELLNDIGNKTLLDTVNKDSLVEAVNEVNTIFGIVGDIKLLTTDDKTSIVNAINDIVLKYATKNDVGNISDLKTNIKTSIVEAINEIVLNYALKADMGNLADLETDVKNSIVGAINSIVKNYALKDHLGDITLLTTTDKSSAVKAINEVNAKKVETTVFNQEVENIYNKIEEVNFSVNNLTINVKSFGAVGDGVTDDYDAIQRTIDFAVSKGGGAVFFPSGTYLISKTLTWKGANISLKGSGIDATIIRDHPSLGGRRLIGLFGTPSQKIRNVNINDITFRNGTATTGIPTNQKDCIRVENVQNIFITNCKFTEVEGFHCFVSKQTKNVLIQNCEFYRWTYSGVMILVECEEINVLDNTFDTATSLLTENTYTFASGGEELGVGEFFVRNMSISRNRFLNNPRWEGIDCHGGENITIDNNFIENCLVGIMCSCSLTYVSKPLLKNVVIRDNKMTSSDVNTTYGIVIQGEYNDVSFSLANNIKIGNNYIDGFGSNEVPVGALTITACENVEVYGNKIVNFKKVGIALNYAIRGCMVQGNEIINCLSNDVLGTGIYMVSIGSYFVTIQQNRIFYNDPNKRVGVGIAFPPRHFHAQVRSNYINVLDVKYSNHIIAPVMKDGVPFRTMGMQTDYATDTNDIPKYYCTDLVLKYNEGISTETYVNGISGSNILNITSGDFRNIPENGEIMITGAGASGANLTATAIKVTNKIIIIDKLVQTNVTNILLKHTNCNWVEV